MTDSASLTMLKKAGAKAQAVSEELAAPAAQAASAVDGTTSVNIDVDAMTSEQLDALCEENAVETPAEWPLWDADAKRAWLKSQFEDSDDKEAENAAAAATADAMKNEPDPPAETGKKGKKAKKEVDRGRHVRRQDRRDRRGRCPGGHGPRDREPEGEGGLRADRQPDRADGRHLFQARRRAVRLHVQPVVPGLPDLQGDAGGQVRLPVPQGDVLWSRFTTSSRTAASLGPRSASASAGPRCRSSPAS